MELRRRQPGVWGSCTEKESYLIVHVCSRAVSRNVFCPALSIVLTCGCCRRSLIWFRWIVLFAVQKGCVTMSSCSLAHRRKVRALCLLYRIYPRVDHSMNGYLDNFVAACNTRTSAALGELALVFLRCRIE